MYKRGSQTNGQKIKKLMSIYKALRTKNIDRLYMSRKGREHVIIEDCIFNNSRTRLNFKKAQRMTNYINQQHQHKYKQKNTKNYNTHSNTNYK